MRRNRLVVLELLLMIIISIGIICVVFSVYFIFRGIGKTIVNVNDNNRLEIEQMLKESSDYDDTYDIKELKKIQFFMNFNDLEFTLYYKKGEEKELYDDNLDTLRDYIKQNGYSKTMYYVVIDVVIIFIVLGVNAGRKNLSNRIDLIDKQDENN